MSMLRVAYLQLLLLTHLPTQTATVSFQIVTPLFFWYSCFIQRPVFRKNEVGSGSLVEPSYFSIAKEEYAAQHELSHPLGMLLGIRQRQSAARRRVEGSGRVWSDRTDLLAMKRPSPVFWRRPAEIRTASELARSIAYAHIYIHAYTHLPQEPPNTSHLSIPSSFRIFSKSRTESHVEFSRSSAKGVDAPQPVISEKRKQ